MAEHDTLYQYQPLQTQDAIRMVELVLDGPENEIHIRIIPRTLLDMPSCAAMSYEWGNPTRHDVIWCDGKRLMVTSNLLKLLLELQSSKEARPLWIDAISINQDDLAERSQQVKSMGEIYRNAMIVLVWLGEPHPFTGEGFKTVSLLAEEHDSIPESERVPQYGLLGHFKSSADVYHGEKLQALTKDPSWAGVMDLYSSRSYFLRLWIVQELMLARDATIMCGCYRLDWESFGKAAYLIINYKFLQKGIDNFYNLRGIRRFVRAKQEIRTSGAGLSRLIKDFSMVNASIGADRIFGLLGMLKDGPQKDSIVVDYNHTPEQVYKNAIESIIVHEQKLDFYDCLYPRPDSATSISENRLPSWVPYIGGPSTTLYIDGLDLLKKSGFKQQKMLVEGNILKLYGIILGTIVFASENVSSANVQSTVQSILSLPSSTRISQIETQSSLWQTLITFNATKEEHRPYLQSPPDLKSHYSHSNDRQRTEDQEMYNSLMAMTLWDDNLGLGRNIFRTNKGYFGVGPGGNYSVAEAPEPVVKVGDCVAIIANATTPFVLRPSGGDYFIMIGQAYVGGIENLLLAKDGQPLELEQIRIR